MEVIIKQFNGDVESSYKKGKKLDPFKEKIPVANGIYRVLHNPDTTLTLLGKNNLVNAVIEGDKLVIVKGYSPKGIVPARAPVGSVRQNIPKATLDIKDFFSKDEIGKFYVIPVIAGKKPRPATVEDLAKNVGRKVKVKRVIGTDFGSRVEFEVSGVTFIGHVYPKSKNYTAKDIVKAITLDTVKEIEKMLKSGQLGRAYNILAGEPVKVKNAIEVKNIVYLAKNFRCKKELDRAKKKLLSTKASQGKLKLSISKFIEEYENQSGSPEVSDDHVLVKIAGMNSRLPEEDIRIGYAVLSKGKKVVFTGGVEVLTETNTGKREKLSIVEAEFGHEFKDTKIIGAMPLTFGELKELEEGVGGYTLEFLKFILS